MLKVTKTKAFLLNILSCSFIYIMVIAAWLMQMPMAPMLSLFAIIGCTLMSIACIPIKIKRMMKDSQWMGNEITKELEKHRNTSNNDVVDDALNTLIQLVDHNHHEIILEYYPSIANAVKENKLQECTGLLHQIKL